MSAQRAQSARRLAWLGLSALVVAGLTYFLWPRQAHLRVFDPSKVARLETAMWRHYYQHEYFSLFRALYALNRDEYYFSPDDSMRISYFAAKAAAVFQRSRSRTEAQAALPILERYFAVLRKRGGERFDVHEAAVLELDWWQRRREEATPIQYGEVIAQVTTEVFGVRNSATAEAALLRAEMMQYRDERRDGRMTADDWQHIEQELTRSYQLLKTGLQAPRDDQEAR